jgi:transcriptional regulator with GAF, ATPase, and Fis domain
VGRLIGPFIETIALLYRERRRQHRIGRLKDIPQALAASLDLREILATVGEAVRPAFDFDTMGVILFKPGGQEYALFGTVGESPVPGIESIPTSQFSCVATLMTGRPVLFQEASKEFNPGWAGDRAMLAAGLESCLWVPLQFGHEVGGALFLGNHGPYWYDDVDVEVATVVASHIILGIQHQRLEKKDIAAPPSSGAPRPWRTACRPPGHSSMNATISRRSWAVLRSFAMRLPGPRRSPRPSPPCW